MRKRIVNVLASLALLAAAFGVGGTASAGTTGPYLDCPAGRACLWSQNYYSGYGPSFEYSIARMADRNYDNMARSVYSHGNDPDCKAVFYDSPNFVGRRVSVPRLQGIDVLGRYGLSREISSAQFVCF